MEETSLLADDIWGAWVVEDAVLEGDADDKVRVLPKTSFACFRMGGEPAVSAPGALASGKPGVAAPALADIDRCKSAVTGAQACRYLDTGTESAGKSDCTCNFI